ncbi:WSC domain-containing protein [Lactarius quietus]|nr:WSC domain-containing protein [Lactarius quietus]
MHSTHFLFAGLQLSIVIWLAIIPFTSATPSPSRTVVQRDEPVLPSKWSSLGCYTDSPSQRTLTAKGLPLPYMTVEYCVSYCNNMSYIYAGLENSTDCYCGNVLTPGATNTSSSLCDVPCGGNSNETCGGCDSLQLYWSGAIPPPQPTFVQNVNSWYYVGCFSDSNDARTLSDPTTVVGGQYNNSVENCINACQYTGYSFAGLEFALQCRCGDAIGNGGEEVHPDLCLLACSGDTSEKCGGANSYVLYVNLDD